MIGNYSLLHFDVILQKFTTENGKNYSFYGFTVKIEDFTNFYSKLDTFILQNEKAQIIIF
jgi:hypothetical protein